MNLAGTSYQANSFGLNVAFQTLGVNSVTPSGTLVPFSVSAAPGAIRYGGALGKFSASSPGLPTSNYNFDIRSITLSEATASSPATVPEPASWALLIAGFGLVGAAARRQRQPAAVLS